MLLPHFSRDFLRVVNCQWSMVTPSWRLCFLCRRGNSVFGSTTSSLASSSFVPIGQSFWDLRKALFLYSCLFHKALIIQVFWQQMALMSQSSLPRILSKFWANFEQILRLLVWVNEPLFYLSQPLRCATARQSLVSAGHWLLCPEYSRIRLPPYTINCSLRM